MIVDRGKKSKCGSILISLAISTHGTRDKAEGYNLCLVSAGTYSKGEKTKSLDTWPCSCSEDWGSSCHCRVLNPLCSRGADTHVRSPGVRWNFHFIPNAFSGVKVSALCRSLDFFHSNLVFIDLILYTGISVMLEQLFRSSEEKLCGYSNQRHPILYN